MFIPLDHIFKIILYMSPIMWALLYVSNRYDKFIRTVKEDAKNATLFTALYAFVTLCLLLSINFIMEAPF